MTKQQRQAIAQEELLRRELNAAEEEVEAIRRLSSDKLRAILMEDIPA